MIPAWRRRCCVGGVERGGEQLEQFEVTRWRYFVAQVGFDEVTGLAGSSWSRRRVRNSGIIISKCRYCSA